MNQTDHVLISNRFRTAITDITQLRGPDIGSDHNLLKINFRVKLRVKTGNKYNEKIKSVSIFQNPKWKQQYATEINNKFEILENFDLLTIILTKNGKSDIHITRFTLLQSRAFTFTNSSLSSMQLQQVSS